MELQKLREKNNETMQLLRQMQLDCYRMTSIIKDVQAILNIRLSDNDIDEWLEAGPFKLVEALYRKATGNAPQYTEVQPGLMRSNDLTEAHMTILKDMGIGQAIFERLLRDLEGLQAINYFGFETVDGHVVIHRNEFEGGGITNIVCYNP